MLGRRKNSKPEKCSKTATNPRRPVHAVLGGFGVFKGVGKWNSIVEHLANIIYTPFFLFGDLLLLDSAYEHSLRNFARSPEIGIESPMDVAYLHEQNNSFAHP
jgi:hypothetical protein